MSWTFGQVEAACCTGWIVLSTGISCNRMWVFLWLPVRLKDPGKCPRFLQLCVRHRLQALQAHTQSARSSPPLWDTLHPGGSDLNTGESAGASSWSWSRFMVWGLLKVTELTLVWIRCGFSSAPYLFRGASFLGASWQFDPTKRKRAAEAQQLFCGWT